MKDNKIKLLDDRTHVLTVPSRYVGSIKSTKRDEYILFTDGFQRVKVEYVPAILTLFKEVISNAIDEFIRTNGKFANKIDIEIKNNKLIKVRDNGRGLPHEIEEKTELPQSVVAFTQLKAGTNFEEETTSIGQNGEGVSLVNIFSNKFDVVTSNGKYKTTIKCKDNLSTLDYKLRKSRPKFTEVRFELDFIKFGLAYLSDDHISMIYKTIIDYQMCYPGIKFRYNSKSVPIKTFKDYVNLYSKDAECFSFDNLDVAVYPSDEFEHISFVNGIYTRRGGEHVNYVSYFLISKLREKLQKKYKEIKPADIRNKFCFVIHLKNMKAPRFDSQTKEELINNNDDFERELLYHYYDNLDQVINKIHKNNKLIDPIVNYFKIKEKWKKQQELEKKEKNLKKAKIPKLIEANSSNRERCILYIGEGKSAVGARFYSCRDSNYHAGYPLRGKFISCQNTPRSKLLKNAEVQDLLAAINLKLTDPSIYDIRYGKIVIACDQDPDGFAIKTTLLNFFYTFWPNLFKNEIIYVAESVLIKAKHEKNKEIRNFFSMEEFYNVNEFDNWKVLKYNKGLGSLNKDEYLFTLNNLVKITEDDMSRELLDIAFDGSFVEERKKWMMC